MKTKILIVLLFTSFVINAQENQYIPLLIQNNQWNELGEAISLPPEYQYERTYITKLGNDTIIGGIHYSKLLTARDEHSSIWNVGGYIREDVDNQKVYYRPVANKPEILLYDFDVQVGSIINTYDVLFQSITGSYVDVTITIVSIETVTIGDRERKKITVLAESTGEVGDDGYYQESHVWIEGIGHLEGFLRSTQAIALSGADRISLLCFLQNDELIYKPERNHHIDDCFVWRYLSDTGLERNTYPNDISIYQNEHKILNIIHAKGKTFNIFNLQGIFIKSIYLNSDNYKINTSDLPRGVYILSCTDVDFNINKKILLK